MIVRKLHQGDQSRVISLGARSGLFSNEELAHLETVVRAAADQDDAIWLVTGDDQIDGAVYAASEPMSDRVWNVLMLIVDPESHGLGVGKALMAAVEEVLAGTARLLLVETSEGDGFEVARVFYPRCGYREVARIPSYYGDNISKIIFQKVLKGTAVAEA